MTWALRQIAPGVLIGVADVEVVVVVQTSDVATVTRALNELPVPEPGQGVEVSLALPGGERVPLDYRVNPRDLERYPLVCSAASSS